MADPRDLLEPAALDPAYACDEPSLAEVGASIAISLKRIADALGGVGENAFTQALNDYGENIGRCIEGQFNRSGR